MDPTHEPVLVAETVALLDPSRGGLFVDCTVGLGGHARAVLDAGASRLLGCLGPERSSTVPAVVTPQGAGGAEDRRNQLSTGKAGVAIEHAASIAAPLATQFWPSSSP